METGRNNQIKAYKKWDMPKSRYFWLSYLDYDDNRSECRGCRDYCRCTTVDPKITEIKCSLIYKEIALKKSIDTVKDYCLERVIYKSFQKDDFSAYGVSGYYGEEVEVAYGGKFDSNLEFILNNDDTACVEYILKLEYGHILPDIKNKEWKIDTVDISTVSAQNYHHVDQTIRNLYINDIKNGFDKCVLCIKHSDDYHRLIDGYHRFAALNMLNNEKIKIVYCDK